MSKWTRVGLALVLASGLGSTALAKKPAAAPAKEPVAEPAPAPTTEPAAPPEKGRITGVGGIFYKSKDPKALRAWYRDVLGLHIEEWGGAALPYDAPAHPPVLVWGVFPEKTEHFAPSTREFMINFGVDDMDAFLARIEAKGVVVLERDDTSDPSGRFAWIMDPDGTKIELWQAVVPPK